MVQFSYAIIGITQKRAYFLPTKMTKMFHDGVVNVFNMQIVFSTVSRQTVESTAFKLQVLPRRLRN